MHVKHMAGVMTGIARLPLVPARLAEVDTLAAVALIPEDESET